MDTKRLVSGTVAGGLVLFVIGYLLYGMLLMDFFAGNMGSATGVEREAPILWAIGVGNLALAALITMVIGTQPGDVSTAQGAKTGAVTMFLIWLGADFIQYGAANIWNLTAVVADVVVSTLMGGIAGAVIAAVAGKKG